MDAKVTKVTDSDFSRAVLESGKPAVVDFWATWCAPCHRLDAILEDIAGEYDGRVSFFRVDVNESNETAARYAVRSLPMLLFFNGGKVVDQAIGSQSREALEEKLIKMLKAS